MVTVKIFKTYASLIEWRDQHNDSVSIAENLPLLSNLNMLENIALIEQVHSRLSVKQAESRALQRLTLIGAESIALKRSPQCTEEEKFLTMLLRATSMPVSQVFILFPLSLMPHEDGMAPVLNRIQQIDTQIPLQILDLQSNLIHYQGLPCLISE